MVEIVNMPGRFLIHVNYGEKATICVERGKYDHVHGIFCRDFSTCHRNEGEVWYELEMSLEYLGYNAHLSGKEAKRKLVNAGLRLAEFHDHLAFGAKYPEIQRYFKIVSLGSTCEHNGNILVPCLTGNDYRRGLIAEPIHTIFYNCRFLAVWNEKKCDHFIYP